MADEVKRVGLVFKEDGSTDFVNSLKKVNAQLKENYQNFQLTQAQWDKSTSSTQKLQDKLVYLNEAYDIQSSKVSTLKQELNELENAENRDETAIQKKKAALAAAETSLQKYKNQITQTTIELQSGAKAIQEFGDKIQNTGKEVKEIGSKFSNFSKASVVALGASVKSAIDFEDAFTGVTKTVDASDDELAEMNSQIRQMAKEIPSSTTEISGVAEAAGQLGIKTKDIMNFTRVMIDLGNSTNLSADEAASALAKFANITNMSADQYQNLGSTIVNLGNNFATTEADIVSMSTRLASTGDLAGLSEPEILALATAMSSVGIEAEAGGTAMSKLLKQLQVAVETGAGLEDFAKIAGMTGKQFQKSFKEDAAKALSAFITGLKDTKRNGKSAISVLDDMGIKDVRLSNTILALSNSSDLMNDAIDTANKAWKENTALSNEANKRYGTLKSQIEVTTNRVKDMGISIGNKLMPSIQNLLGDAEKLTNKFDELDDSQVELIIRFGIFTAATAPVIKTVGNLTEGVGKLVKSYGDFRLKIAEISVAAEESGSAMTGLINIIGGLTSPMGLAVAAVVGGITAITIASEKAQQEVNQDFTTIGNSANDFITGIKTANSHLSEFNSTLFASNEEQQSLQTNMQEVQNGITTICKTASDERRGYTQEEITQLDEYFTKLRDLKDRELQIQSEIATAITQQATTNAESFQGSLDEYKQQSQEWINTAIQQKDTTLKTIEEQTTQEIVLLNQRYNTTEARSSEAYQKEYNDIMTRKEEKINQANDEVAKVTEAYSTGYTQRVSQEDGFTQKLQEYQEKRKKNDDYYANEKQKILNGEEWWVTDTYSTLNKNEEARVRNNKKSAEDLYKNMSDSEAEQLGIWLGNLANTELYGGKISDKDKEMVDTILSTYDSMPKGTRKAMKNAMSPMLTEMEKSEPSLFKKATNIADGILSRLRKSFDIHSPSRKTRKIMQFAMQPMEEEMDKGSKKLFEQADSLAEGVTDRLSNINGDIDTNNVSKQGGYSYVLQANYNANKQQEIDYAKLSQLMTNSFLKALNSCKMKVDKDGFAKLVDDRLMEVM